jgi:hypothetical protein
MLTAQNIQHYLTYPFLTVPFLPTFEQPTNYTFETSQPTA